MFVQSYAYGHALRLIADDLPDETIDLEWAVSNPALALAKYNLLRFSGKVKKETEIALANTLWYVDAGLPPEPTEAEKADWMLGYYCTDHDQFLKNVRQAIAAQSDEEGNPGAWILNARKAADMSQQDFADFVGVNRVSLSNWETGTKLPSDRTVQKLREAISRLKAGDA